MGIDPMTKMNISLLAIFFMFVCNVLIMVSRKRQNSLIRMLLRTIAFILLFAVFIMIVIVIFA